MGEKGESKREMKKQPCSTQHTTHTNQPNWNQSTDHQKNRTEQNREEIEQEKGITQCMRWSSGSVQCSSGDFTRVMKICWATWSWMQTRMWVMMWWQMRKVRRHGRERWITMISRRTTICRVGTGVGMG